MNELDRYTTQEMTTLWSLDWKFRRWAEIEIEAARAVGAPLEALEQMRMAGAPTARAVAAEEAKTRHDVIAFLNCWRVGMGPEGRAWTHRGLTSSDVVDTANAMRMVASADLIRSKLKDFTGHVIRNAILYKDAVRVGRTHGQSAEVTTWGWRLAGFAYDLLRAEQRFALLSTMYNLGKMSGPVGDYKTIRPFDEQIALSNLGLKPVGATTQVVPRDVYVDYLHCLAQVASVIESIALEIRLSSRSEVAEMREGTLGSQRGSSAMPHKRNPITSEQLCGLARVVRAQVAPVADGVALHHERDISHSSVERVALALASKVTDYMLNTATDLVSNLQVYPDRMRANLVGNDDVRSSLIKDRLVTEFGVDPGDAYEVVFWAFRHWNDPDGAYESLADALQAAWIEMDWRAFRPYDADQPCFKVMLEQLSDPARLVGQTDQVFADLKSRLSLL